MGCCYRSLGINVCHCCTGLLCIPCVVKRGCRGDCDEGEKREKMEKWEECKEEAVNSKGDDGGGGDWKGVGSGETD